MSQIRSEESHLVGSNDEHARRGGDRLDRSFDIAARNFARRLLNVEVIGDQRRLKFVLIKREEWLGAGTPTLLAAGNTASVLLAGRTLELREAIEAMRLREAHYRRA
jgi:hypothetical protein